MSLRNKLEHVRGALEAMLEDDDLAWIDMLGVSFLLLHYTNL